MTTLTKSLLAASTLLIAAVSTQAQSSIGYTSGQMGRNTICRMGMTEKQGLAIKLNHDKLQALAGTSISDVKLAFGSKNTDGKVADLFITTDLDADPLYTQQISIASANKWQTVTLDTPYTITGEEEELYVGYTASIATTYSLLQTDHTNDLRGCTYAWNNGEWTDLYGTGYGSANLYLGLSEEVSFSDAMLAELDLTSNYYIANQEYKHTTRLFNFGTQTITSLEISISMGWEESVAISTELSIPQFGSYEVELPQLTNAAEGNVNVEVKARILDADEEADTSDNGFSSSAYFYPANIERNVFVEEFTGMTCPNCPAGKRLLESAIEQSGIPCVEIMHHSGYSADDFTTNADAEYTWFYGSESTFAPGAMFNRLTNPASGAGVPIIPATSQSSLLSSLQYASLLQPYASLALTSDYDPESRMVEVDFSLFDHNALPGNTVLNVYLVQDSIIRSQSGASGDYYHNGVLRKVLTDSDWGLLLPNSFTPGEHLDYHISYELPEAIYSDYYSGSNPQYSIPTDPEHTRIIAFIASYDNADYNNNMVYNCIEVPLINGSCTQSGMPSALESIQEDGLSKEYACDLQGRPVDARTNLPAGLYTINGKKILIRNN